MNDLDRLRIAANLHEAGKEGVHTPDYGVVMAPPRMTGETGRGGILAGRRGQGSVVTRQTCRKIDSCCKSLSVKDWSVRRGGRVVEGGGLENRCTGNRTVGSNPTSSASLRSPSASFGSASQRAPTREGCRAEAALRRRRTSHSIRLRSRTIPRELLLRLRRRGQNAVQSQV
jgi:hypothetical protein